MQIIFKNHLNSKIKSKFKNFTINFINDEAGQSTTEYILMLMIVVAIALKFKGKITGYIDSATGKIGQSIESASGEK